MSWTTPKTWTIGEILTKVDLDAQLRDNLGFLKLNIALETAVALTIASGAITKTRSHHTVDTEGGASADYLDTINGGSEGEALLIRPANGARVTILRSGIGNILLPSGGTMSLDNAGKYVLLIFNGTNWCVISGAGSTGGGSGDLDGGDVTDPNNTRVSFDLGGI